MSRAQLTSTVEQNSAGAAAPVVAGKNYIANSGFDIWQRGTSFTFSSTVAASTSTYTADRWAFGGTGAFTVTQQTPSNTASPYALRLQRTSGNSTSGDSFITYTMETNTAKLLAGQTVTLSFYMKAGSGFTGTTTYIISRFGTGTDEGSNAGYSGLFTGSNQIIKTQTPTTTSTKYSYTFVVPSSTKEMIFLIGYSGASGTAGSNDYLEYEQMQLELGSVATPFSRAGGTLQGELALAMRYYYRATSVGSSSNYQHFGMGQAYSSSAAKVPIPLPVAMRTAPSISSTGSLGLLNAANSAIGNASVGADGVSTTVAGTYWTGSSGLVAGNATTLIANGNSSCYIEFSSEL